jgi:hypothetical protein
MEKEAVRHWQEEEAKRDASPSLLTLVGLFISSPTGFRLVALGNGCVLDSPEGEAIRPLLKTCLGVRGVTYVSPDLMGLPMLILSSM